MRTARTSNSEEPQQKYRLGTVSIEILGEGGVLKPVLRDIDLALSCFWYMTRIMNNRNGNVKHKTKHLVLRKAG